MRRAGASTATGTAATARAAAPCTTARPASAATSAARRSCAARRAASAAFSAIPTSPALVRCHLLPHRRKNSAKAVHWKQICLASPEAWPGYSLHSIRQCQMLHAQFEPAWEAIWAIMLHRRAMGRPVLFLKFYQYAQAPEERQWHREVGVQPLPRGAGALLPGVPAGALRPPAGGCASCWGDLAVPPLLRGGPP